MTATVGTYREARLPLLRNLAVTATGARRQAIPWIVVGAVYGASFLAVLVGWTQPLQHPSLEFRCLCAGCGSVIAALCASVAVNFKGVASAIRDSDALFFVKPAFIRIDWARGPRRFLVISRSWSMLFLMWGTGLILYAVQAGRP
jgi:hypothetical protein